LIAKGSLYEIELRHLINAYVRGYLKPNHNLNDRLVKNYIKYETDITSSKEYLDIKLPMIFQVLWEKVNRKKIIKLSKNESWMALTTFICESCYLTATE
jgi:hypothetical protein